MDLTPRPDNELEDHDTLQSRRTGSPAVPTLEPRQGHRWHPEGTGPVHGPGIDLTEPRPLPALCRGLIAQRVHVVMGQLVSPSKSVPLLADQPRDSRRHARRIRRLERSELACAHGMAAPSGPNDSPVFRIASPCLDNHDLRRFRVAAAARGEDHRPRTETQPPQPQSSTPITHLGDFRPWRGRRVPAGERLRAN